MKRPSMKTVNEAIEINHPDFYDWAKESRLKVRSLPCMLVAGDRPPTKPRRSDEMVYDWKKHRHSLRRSTTGKSRHNSSFDPKKPSTSAPHLRRMTTFPTISTQSGASRWSSIVVSTPSNDAKNPDKKKRLLELKGKWDSMTSSPLLVVSPSSQTTQMPTAG
ncbi:expressed unknown protein [Seminavis robusta]|uniref:Uncharacterized protein n=1 Tax=Seminavis robusta TaxID=568900 RepID=A0A9N8HC53_9STRA|nr:expressed unknown protein [Seminavis robusta]|eukprot:Sro286_g108460.1 n/a (162) ;mRNA; r:78150-78635